MGPCEAGGTRKWTSRFVVCCTLACFLGASPTASAQTQDQESGGLFAASAAAIGLSPLTSLTSTLGTTVGGGVTLLIVLLNNTDGSAWKREYLRKNAVALQHDLTVGSGESIRDLAVAFRVDRADYSAFARTLHRRRGELVALADVSKLDADRADRFFSIIVRGMESHPRLRDDLDQLRSSAMVNRESPR